MYQLKPWGVYNVSTQAREARVLNVLSYQPVNIAGFLSVNYEYIFARMVYDTYNISFIRVKNGQKLKLNEVLFEYMSLFSKYNFSGQRGL